MAIKIALSCHMATIILFPGLGASKKLFQQYDFGKHKTIVAEFLVPLHGEKLVTYCKRMSTVIPPNDDLIFIGVSFGGIVAQEIAKYLKPKKIILISSIKSKSEKPPYFLLLRMFPVYQILPVSFLKKVIVQFGEWFTPKSDEEQEFFLALLKEANTEVIRWGIWQTIHWNQQRPPVNIIHIQGTSDHLFPIRYIKADYTIEKGSHFMIIQRSVEINSLLNQLIRNFE